MPDLPNHVIANAGLLFRNALEVCQAISTPPDMVPHRSEALASILFAALATEAFVNELGELAKVFTIGRSDLPGWIATLTSILEEAEESKASVETKYQFAKFVLTGQPYDEGAQPYQDLALLTDVRNSLVHIKSVSAKMEKKDSGEYEWTEPRLMVRLMRRLQELSIKYSDDSLRRVTERSDSNFVIADLVSLLSSQSVATWACRAAAGIINATIDSIPVGSFRDFIQIIYPDLKI